MMKLVDYLKYSSLTVNMLLLDSFIRNRAVMDKPGPCKSKTIDKKLFWQHEKASLC